MLARGFTLSKYPMYTMLHIRFDQCVYYLRDNALRTPHDNTPFILTDYFNISDLFDGAQFICL